MIRRSDARTPAQNHLAGHELAVVLTERATCRRRHVLVSGPDGAIRRVASNSAAVNSCNSYLGWRRGNTGSSHSVLLTRGLNG
jgi:hypothetical protein